MTATQGDLFGDDRDLEARIRRAAWLRCCNGAVYVMGADDRKDPVALALAVEAMATYRIAYDLADGLRVDQFVDTTGLAFLGYLRGDDPIPPPAKGKGKRA